MLMMLMLLLLLDLGFIESSHQAIGESGGEDSEDEWNYVKVDKKSSDGLAAVEEATEPIVESPSPVIEQQQETGFVVEEDRQNEFEDNNVSKLFARRYNQFFKSIFSFFPVG